jgi:hypothetical protein
VLVCGVLFLFLQIIMFIDTVFERNEWLIEKVNPEP